MLILRLLIGTFHFQDFPKDTEVYSEWLKFQNKIQTRSIDEAQKILDSNMEEVKKVRQSLETLQTILQDSFAKFPPTNKFATNEKQDF